MRTPEQFAVHDFLKIAMGARRPSRCSLDEDVSPTERGSPRTHPRRKTRCGVRPVFVRIPSRRPESHPDCVPFATMTGPVSNSAETRPRLHSCGIVLWTSSPRSTAGPTPRLVSSSSLRPRDRSASRWRTSLRRLASLSRRRFRIDRSDPPRVDLDGPGSDLLAQDASPPPAPDAIQRAHLTGDPHHLLEIVEMPPAELGSSPRPAHGTDGFRVPVAINSIIAGS